MAMVTVLVAAYNNEKYISELLESVLSQSFSDIRVIARDDFSTDGTPGILAEYERRDERLSVIYGKEQSGSAANNFYKLLSLDDDSPYVMFADADDVWLPDKIKLTLERMTALEARRGKNTPLLVHCDLAITDERLNVIAQSMVKYEKLSPERTALRNLLSQNNVTGCAMMVNRALASFAKTPPESSVMHDWWLALAAAAFGEAAFVDAPLILYRQHAGNQVGAYDASSAFASARRLLDKKRNRDIYDRMFAQALCFAEAYKGTLNAQQLELCKAYAGMKGKSKLQKIRTIFKYGFFKNTLTRNVGQVFVI